MKTTFEREGDHVALRVSDYDPKYEEVLKTHFYTKENDTYVKRFSASVPHLDAVGAHYERYMEDMLSQLGRFTPTRWQEALLALIQRLEGTGIFWWLTGSCSAAIRGVALEPHDIDLMYDCADFGAMADLFADCTIEPFIETGGWVTRHFGVVFLHARIDVAGDPQPCLDDPEPADCGPYARAHLETVQWMGHDIHVPPLELLVAVNRRRGREERAQLIEQFLREQQAVC